MRKDIRILLVEDNKYHATLIERGIAERYADASLDVFATGRAALESAQTHHYDIAVIEQELSDYDGLELLALLRKEDLDLPVIITSTSSSEQMVSSRTSTWAETIRLLRRFASGGGSMFGISRIRERPIPTKTSTSETSSRSSSNCSISRTILMRRPISQRLRITVRL